MRHGRNPHDELAPTMSALVIIAHVKEGVDLALKHGLNQEIIDVIQQHHGTSLVYLLLQARPPAAGRCTRRRQDHEYSRRGHPGSARRKLPLPRPAAADAGSAAIISPRRFHRKRLAQPGSRHPAEDRPAHQRHHRDSGSSTGSSRNATSRMREIRGTSPRASQHTLQSMMHSRVAYPSDRAAGEKREPSPPAVRANTSPISAA